MSLEELSSESGTQIIEQTLDFFINSGVVGALIFGVLFSYVMGPLPISETSEEYFGAHTIDILIIFYYIFVYTALFIAIWIVFSTIHSYLHLSLW